MQSTNHLIIIDPRTTKRLKNQENNWIPVPLIMAFIREKGNIIDYEIPITGNFKNPQFHLKDVILDLLRNIFVQPATLPYKVHVKNVETEIEKSLIFNWNMRQCSLSPAQEKFIAKLAHFLLKNPGADIAVHPMSYEIKEKEYILFFEAKKVYYKLANNINAKSFNSEDSEKVDAMSVKDSAFVHYLDKQVNDSMLYTIQEKCKILIDSSVINAELERINKERETAFIHYFKERGLENRVKISTYENIIPYNGFSYYKIEYQGEFPESLIKAYKKMYEFNDKAPRKKFEQERKESGNP